MKLTVAELEAYLARQYSGRVSDQSLFMKLVEEMGELAEVLNKREGRKAKGDENINADFASEIADVIHYAVAIAAVNGIDLADTILEKDKKASLKYGRKQNLENFISENQ